MVRTKAKGFTLIELLVAILIISIVLTFAFLALGDMGRSRELRFEAKKIQRLMQLAQKQAIVDNMLYGFAAEHSGFYFYRFEWSKPNLKGKWHLLDKDFALHPEQIRSDFKLTLSTQTQEIKLTAKQPAVLFHPSGDVTAFTLQLAEVNGKAKWLVGLDQAGQVSLESKTS